jgi:hypothetical protein
MYAAIFSLLAIGFSKTATRNYILQKLLAAGMDFHPVSEEVLKYERILFHLQLVVLA